MNWDYKFDPPEGHEDICNCRECHAEHDLVENYGSPDFRCCTDDVDRKIEIGEWCQVKPLIHTGSYMDGKLMNGRFVRAVPPKCLECV